MESSVLRVLPVDIDSEVQIILYSLRIGRGPQVVTVLTLAL